MKMCTFFIRTLNLGEEQNIFGVKAQKLYTVLRLETKTSQTKKKNKQKIKKQNDDMRKKENWWSKLLQQHHI